MELDCPKLSTNLQTKFLQVGPKENTVYLPDPFVTTLKKIMALLRSWFNIFFTNLN